MKNNVKIEEIVVIWSFHMIIPYKTIECNEFFVKRNDIKILLIYDECSPIRYSIYVFGDTVRQFTQPKINKSQV